MIDLLALRRQPIENRAMVAFRFAANLANTGAGLVWRILKHQGI
jgi:hypothetical protein